MTEYGPGSSGAVFKYRKMERSSRCDAKERTGKNAEDPDLTVEESMELLREELKKELPDLVIE